MDRRLGKTNNSTISKNLSLGKMRIIITTGQKEISIPNIIFYTGAFWRATVGHSAASLKALGIKLTNYEGDFELPFESEDEAKDTVSWSISSTVDVDDQIALEATLKEKCW